jgi:uncharacterized protein
VIFVDTSFWMAAIRNRDQNHETARALAEMLHGDTLVTTTAVRGETWTGINSRYGHEWAKRAIGLIEASPRITIRQIDADLDSDALKWLRDRSERPYSWVDATSFALMRRERIRRALTFDSDFEAAGFEIVRP